MCQQNKYILTDWMLQPTRDFSFLHLIPNLKDE